MRAPINDSRPAEMQQDSHHPPMVVRRRLESEPAENRVVQRGTSLSVADRASGVSTLFRMLPAYLRYLAR